MNNIDIQNSNLKRIFSMAIIAVMLSVSFAYADNDYFDHDSRVNAVKNFLKFEIKTNGKITPEQQTIVDFVITLMEGQNARVRIETEGLKIKASGTVENKSLILDSIDALGDSPGKIELKVNNNGVNIKVTSKENKDNNKEEKDDDRHDNNGCGRDDCYDDREGRHDDNNHDDCGNDDCHGYSCDDKNVGRQVAEEAISRAQKAIGNCTSKNAEKHLAKALEAFENGKYGKAYGQATAAYHIAKEACHNLPKPVKRNSTIYGMKFDDVNGNGLIDNDTGLVNWTITLTGPVNATTTTDANGSYKFKNLPAGTYVVSENQQSGWIATTPNNYTVSVNKTSIERNFGNFKHASINGTVFDDVNGNNVKDTNETGLPNKTVTLNAINTTTDNNGVYIFTSLGPGTYNVTSHGVTKTATTSSGQTTTVNIGVNTTVPTTIVTGVKFEDVNGNGLHDSGEPGLANWTILLDNASTTTDANGIFSFTATAGTYTLSEVQQNGWAATTNNSYQITVSNSTVTHDFGNFKLGVINGTVFNDANNNSLMDGETGLANWTVTLNGATALTNENGFYSFTGLTAGEYNLTQVTQANWTLTTPGNFILNVSSGSVTEKNFGNFFNNQTEVIE